MDNLKRSIEDFLKACRDAKTAWAGLDGHIKNCDLKTQDFLHALELENLSYRQRASFAKKETLNRQERRALKDE